MNNDNSAHGFTEGSDIPSDTIGITYYQIACEIIRDQEKRIKELEEERDHYAGLAKKNSDIALKINWENGELKHKLESSPVSVDNQAEQDEMWAEITEAFGKYAGARTYKESAMYHDDLEVCMSLFILTRKAALSKASSPKQNEK